MSGFTRMMREYPLNEPLKVEFVEECIRIWPKSPFAFLFEEEGSYGDINVVLNHYESCEREHDVTEKGDASNATVSEETVIDGLAVTIEYDTKTKWIPTTYMVTFTYVMEHNSDFRGNPECPTYLITCYWGDEIVRQVRIKGLMPSVGLICEKSIKHPFDSDKLTEMISSDCDRREMARRDMSERKKRARRGAA
mmetsp:Transcript_21542/g.59839  ORF Transcript_21542/g.59839 Transcript_21542/m.59839 type:complete len:194 (-) Transcript_21542:118-699(-)|eukprot:CAMPEP_0172372262 /NCGR_PEP_ID=MMETSP1060-20121228/46732_1 /TAXON_ID=37318 /ORGANISM="Pseudo-nitzschia pungens, Strain cf. cingulata" /LENGTH=193 /DNA_ID=CAMNT_0013098177 /DNA_START=87 /DNA_END=668 /DNA_ORIENTATION=-